MDLTDEERQDLYEVTDADLADLFDSVAVRRVLRRHCEFPTDTDKYGE